MARPKKVDKVDLETQIEEELVNLMAMKDIDDPELRLKILDRAIKWQRSKQGGAGGAFANYNEEDEIE